MKQYLMSAISTDGEKKIWTSNNRPDYHGWHMGNLLTNSFRVENIIDTDDQQFVANQIRIATEVSNNAQYNLANQIGGQMLSGLANNLMAQNGAQNALANMQASQYAGYHQGRNSITDITDQAMEKLSFEWENIDGTKTRYTGSGKPVFTIQDGTEFSKTNISYACIFGVMFLVILLLMPWVFVILKMFAISLSAFMAWFAFSKRTKPHYRVMTEEETKVRVEDAKLLEEATKELDEEFPVSTEIQPMHIAS